LRELAIFYTPESIPPKETDVEDMEDVEETDTRRGIMLRAVETVIFPGLKRRFIAVKGLVDEKRVVEVADLPGLYRIFERC
jgi:DNA mismatch repair protein MLH1